MKTSLVLAVLLALLPQASLAQPAAWPNRPIRMVVGFPAGGVTDVAARVVAQPMGVRLGQPVVIENKPGAAGNIAADQVAKAAADGYTILLGTNASHGSNPSLYANVPFDPVKDFAPIGMLATITNVLVVHPSVAASSVQELIAQMRAKPGQFNFASAAVGSAGHLVGEMFRLRTGVDIVHVAYKGAAPMQADLLAGRVQLSFATLQTVLKDVNAGQLRALGVTSPQRIAQMPNVPTLAETVLPGFSADAWFALFAPANTPPEIVSRLNAAVAHAAADPDVRGRLQGQGFAIATSTPEELRRFVAAEVPRWAEVVRASGAKAQ
jgi:tripartite-type tricarboxylate transporter receptor subunit TctC